MNNRKERILKDLKEDKHFIESLINKDLAKIDQYEKALSFHRNEWSQINELIRKLEK